MKIFKLNSKDIDLYSLKKEDINFLKDIGDNYLLFKSYIYNFLISYIDSNISIDKTEYIEVKNLYDIFSEEELQNYVFINITEYYEYDNSFIVVDLINLVDLVIEYISEK